MLESLPHPALPRPWQAPCLRLQGLDVSSLQLPGAIRDFLSLSTLVSWTLRGEVNTIHHTPGPASVSLCLLPSSPSQSSN